VADTWITLLTEALQEIGVIGQGEIPGAARAQAALSKLNRLLDAWNADDVLVYNEDIVTYTLVPNLQPHTIGPDAATFARPQRPISIKNANIVLNNVNPSVNSPLALRDSDWWMAQRVQQLANQLPTDLYYNTSIPNGSLFLWPIPQVAYGIQLDILTILEQVLDTELNDPLVLSPGYRDAITYSLAESMAPSFFKDPSASLIQLAAKARGKIVQANTQETPRIMTWDSGMPDTEKNKPTFNYLTGSTR
jgi:hypothetical protein